MKHFWRARAIWARSSKNSIEFSDKECGMAKIKPRPMYGTPRPAGGGGGGNMMAQLQRLQEEMARAQEQLANETVEVSAGGGMVKAVMTGQQKLVSITIAPEAVDPDDVEMLQDMIVAAVNEALERSQALAAARMGALTGGLNLPGLT
jgi:DNA-binding YbaB/EbfC family protein